MGILDRLLGKKLRQPDPVDFTVGWRKLSPFMPIMYDERPIEERFVSWDYICTERNATAIANLPLCVYTRDRKAGKGASARYKSVAPHARKAAAHTTGMLMDDAVEDATHPILSVLRHPNPILDQFNLLWLTAVYQQMRGVAYWYVRMNQLGQPFELWPLPAHRMVTIFGSGERLIEYYELRYAGNVVRFDPDEIVAFRRPSPMDPMMAHSPTDGIKNASEINMRMIEYEHGLLQHFAVPDTLVIPEQEITEPQARKEEARWRQLFGGWKQRGKTAFATYKLSVEKLGMTNRELQFKEGKPQIKEEIAAGRGVPIPIVSADGSTFANMATGLKLWAEFTVNPWARSIASGINRHLMPLYGVSRGADPMRVGRDPSSWVAFESAVPSDEAAQADLDVKRTGGPTMTVNEVRLERGMEELRDPQADRLRGETAQPVPFGALAPMGGWDIAPVGSAGDDEADEIPTVAMDPGITFDGLSQAMERAARVGDVDTVNMLREEMARRMGRAAPAPLTELTPPQAPQGASAQTPEDDDDDDDDDDDKDSAKAAKVEARGDSGHEGGSDADAEDPPPDASDNGQAVKADGFTPRTALEAFNCGLYPDTSMKLGVRRVGQEVRDEAFVGAIQGMWSAIEQEVVANLGVAIDADKGSGAPLATKRNTDELIGEVLDARKWKTAFASMAKDYLKDAFQKGGELGITDLRRFGHAVPDDGVAVPADVVLEQVDQLSKRFASSVVRVNGDELRKAMRETIEAGLTWRDLSKAVAEIYATNRDYKSDRIARTELSNALNGGAQASWKEAGVEHNEWLTSVDACEFCMKMSGKRRRVGKSFVAYGQAIIGVDGGRMVANYKDITSPTLHPHCQCTLIPVVEK